jgi:hypothetical protein
MPISKLPTEAMIEAGADAYHEAVAAAKAKRQARNEIHEAQGNGRPAPEDASFPADWLEPVWLAMESARPTDQTRQMREALERVSIIVERQREKCFETRADDFGQAMRAIDAALADKTLAASPDGDDIMIGQFVARWEEAADGVMMDADTAQALARCFKEMSLRPSGEAIMELIDKDLSIPTDIAVKVYAAIKRASLAASPTEAGQ